MALKTGHQFPHLVKHTTFCFILLSATDRNKHKAMKITGPPSSSLKDIDTRAVTCEILTGSRQNWILFRHLFTLQININFKKSIYFCILLWIRSMSLWSASLYKEKKTPLSQEKEGRKGNWSDWLQLIPKIHLNWWSETATSLSGDCNILRHTFKVFHVYSQHSMCCREGFVVVPQLSS